MFGDRWSRGSTGHPGLIVTGETRVTERGKIWLVGAGPGDPELLTVKALRLIREADTLVYDRLVSAEILALVPDEVSRVYVGKATGRHTLDQEQINALLVDLARKQQRVVRLKGGDPFIFGRGSEEALALARHGIPFEIVPGITAGQACAAYAGIPLTHRGLAHGVQFITGHRRDGERSAIDAAAAADPGQTLVVYMGLARLAGIVDALIAAGRAADTPAAVIERGTTPRQRQLVTTLARLPAVVESAAVTSPALVVIGEVVSLSAELDWFLPFAEEAQLRYA